MHTRLRSSLPTLVNKNHKMSDARDTPNSVAPAERIRDLLTIDRDVTQVLRSASEVINALTNKHQHPVEVSSQDTTLLPESQNQLDTSKSLFEMHINEFYTLVQSITARLRRQAYALEEAHMIVDEPASTDPEPPPSVAQVIPMGGRPSGPALGGPAAQLRPEPSVLITNGGLGNFNIGWLNSRRDEVGKQKEAELWAAARMHLEKMQVQSSRHQDQDNMEVDTIET